MVTEFVAISSLSVMPDYQMRASLSDDVISEYASLIDGNERQWVFSEPCRVIRVGKLLILVDGFHRVAAMVKCGKAAVLCEITDGTEFDALRAALGSNAKHGALLTNADKRRKVTVALEHETIGKLSHRQVADLCGVSHELVSQVGTELSTADTSVPDQEVSIGADGKNYPSSKDASKKQREKIAEAIVANPKATDREISKIAGGDLKTVARVRAALGKAETAAASAAIAQTSIAGVQVVPAPVVSAESQPSFAPSCDKIHDVLKGFQKIEKALQKLFTDDVRKYGQRTPVLIDENGVLLDGRSRVVACQELGIPVRYDIFHGTESEKEAIVYSMNLNRRPMTVSQLAMLFTVAGL
jgi:ParB-like chromosome segregation protein Spo0J